MFSSSSHPPRSVVGFYLWKKDSVISWGGQLIGEILPETPSPFDNFCILSTALDFFFYLGREVVP